MKTNLKSQVELITPSLAIDYLRSNKCNRPVNKTLVSYFADQMRRGQWKLNGEPIIFLENRLLGDGQHRLIAVIESNTNIYSMVIRGADNDSFLTYDSGRSRLVSDIFALKGINEWVNVAACINKYFSLISENNIFYEEGTGTNNKRRKKSNQDFLDEYDSSPELYQEAIKLSRELIRKMNILTKSEFGSLYVFLIKNKRHPNDKVLYFFKGIINGGPEYGIINLLREKLIKGTIGNNVMTPWFKRNLIVKTWNYYITKNNVSRLTYDESKEGKLNFI